MKEKSGKRFLSYSLKRSMAIAMLMLIPFALSAQEEGAGADATADATAELATGLNTVWMLLAAMLVFSCSRDLHWSRQDSRE